MQVSNWVIFGTVQAYTLLLIISLFLLFQTRSLKKLIGRLQQKLQQLIQEIKQTKAENQQLRDNSGDSGSYVDQLDRLIDETRDRHQSLNPDSDIIFDLNPDSPLPRQTCAFRFASLVSEKESALSGTNNQTNWDVLETKFTHLLALIRDSAARLEESDSELETTLQQLENLKRYEKLFHQMESRWQAASDLAESYYQQLKQIQVADSDQDAFQTLLERFRNEHQQLGDTAGPTPEVTVKTITNTLEFTKTDPKTLKELKQLRAVASDQYQLINQLQEKLKSAQTPQQRDEIIRELQQDLQRQIRFVSEAETCIQLLEDELQSANHQIDTLEQQLAREQKSQSRMAPLKQAVTDMEMEIRQLQKTINSLEKENHQLADQVLGLTSMSAPDSQPFKQQLTDLKRKYTELETRYLELKMKS